MEFDISGARIFFRIPTGIPVLGDILITETWVVSWIVMAIITGLCIYLTRDLKVEKISKRQAIAEMLVDSANNLVRNNTGGTKFDRLIPFVAALFATSVVSNLISLTGILRSPTADLSTEADHDGKDKVRRRLGLHEGIYGADRGHDPFQHPFRACYACQYGLPSFRQYFVRRGNQRSDLCSAGGGLSRIVRSDPRFCGRISESCTYSERRYSRDPVILL